MGSILKQQKIEQVVLYNATIQLITIHTCTLLCCTCIIQNYRMTFILNKPNVCQCQQIKLVGANLKHTPHSASTGANSKQSLEPL